MTALNLIPGQLSLSQLRDVYQHPVKLTLDNSASAQIEASVACVEQILAENRTAYGINTGFGLLASTRIASEDLENLQRSLVLSHVLNGRFKGGHITRHYGNPAENIHAVQLELGQCTYMKVLETRF